jgi:hypothetical protein
MRPTNLEEWLAAEEEQDRRRERRDRALENNGEFKQADDSPVELLTSGEN